MTTEVRCPNPECGQAYSVASDRLRAKGRCKKCGAVFKLSSSPDRSADSVSRETASESKDSSMLDQLGRFLIRDHLGSGAFGTVYRAFDPSLDREVALKVPQAGLLDSPRAVERFLREARAAARLRHPHIVPLFETGLDGGRHYIASAYIEGTTLAEIIEPGGIPPSRAAKIALQLADALHYAHSEKIVHRDVKPTNVMLDAKGDAHLMDFGLARFELSEEKLTQDGAILGTPAYMAPEQAIGRSGEANAASDQYSLGVTLYELLCGQTPFSGPPEVVLFQVIQKEPQRPLEINPAIPRDLETICLKAMAKAPSDRYADCGHLSDDLRRWLLDEPIHARRHGILEQSRRWARRNPAVAGLTLVVGILLTAVALGATIQEQRARSQTKLAKDMANRLGHEQVQTKAALREAETQRHEADLQRAKAETQGREAAAQKVVAEEATRRARFEQEQTKKEQEKLKTALDYSQRLLCKSTLDRGLLLCEQGKTDDGMQWLGRALEIAAGAKLPEYDRVIRCNLAACSRSWIDPSLKNFDTGGKCMAVAFSRDGNTIMTGGGDGSVRLWDANTGTPVGKPGRHQGYVISVKLSPDGAAFLTGSNDRTARLWDAKTCNPIGPTLSHPDSVNDVVFSPDGSTILTGCEDGHVRFWDSKSGESLRKPYREHGKVRVVAFKPDGTAFLTGCDDGYALMRDFKTGEPVGRNFYNSGRAISSAVFSPGGKTVVIGKIDGTARLWDVESGQIVNRFDIAEGVHSVAFSPDGYTVAVGGGDKGGTISLWDVQSAVMLGQPIYHGGQVYCAVFSPDGSTLLSGADSARLWKPDRRFPEVRRSQSFKLIRPQGDRKCIAVSPDGLLAAFDSPFDDLMDIINVKSGTRVGKEFRHPAGIRKVRFSPDGAKILTASIANFNASIGNTSICVWDVASGVQIGKEFGKESRSESDITSAAFSPGGNTVLTGSAPPHQAGYARIWDIATGTQVGKEFQHPASVTSVAFSPDGAKILTGSGQYSRTGYVRIWDVASGVQIRKEFRHPSDITSAVFSPDGNTILTSTAQNAYLWDAKTFEPLGRPFRILNRSLNFSPDGKSIIAFDDGILNFYQVGSTVFGTIDQIVLWIQCIVWSEIDAEGNIHDLDYSIIEGRRKRLQEIGKPTFLDLFQ